MAKKDFIQELSDEEVQRFFLDEGKNFRLCVKVKPQAVKDRLYLSPAGELCLSVREAAIEGAANNRVIEIVAQLFKVPKSSVEILRGESARIKSLLIKK